MDDMSHDTVYIIVIRGASWYYVAVWISQERKTQIRAIRLLKKQNFYEISRTQSISSQFAQSPTKNTILIPNVDTTAI